MSQMQTFNAMNLSLEEHGDFIAELFKKTREKLEQI